MAEALKTYVLDILSILFPGALLILILNQSAWILSVISDLNIPDVEVEWIRVLTFVGLAYIVGHFLFFIGSFLDDWIFENVKKVFWTDTLLVAYIIKYKSEMTGIEDRKVLNAFKWSCVWLLHKNPTMYAATERYIAESKFFRSLVVVLSVAVFMFAFKAKYSLALVSFLFLIFSFIRYLTQRKKSIETAYHFVITASEKKFAIKPIDLVAKLSQEKIDPCKNRKQSKAKPITAWKKSISDFFCFVRKVVAVLNLCLNPFRIVKNNVL